MNKCYIYYEPKEEKFLCHFFYNNEEEIVEATEEILSEIDKAKFKKIKVIGNAFNLSNDHVSCSIYDMEKFASCGLMRCVPNISKQIYKYIFKTQMKNFANDVKIFVNKHKKVIICAALVASILSYEGIHHHATKNNNIPTEKTITNDTSVQAPNTIVPVRRQREVVNIIDEQMELENETQIVNMQYDGYEEEVPNYIDVDFDYDNLTESEKYQYARNIFFETVSKYSEKWGVDTELMMAILTQESGGKEKNLMQITFDAWANEVIEVYNFTDGRYQKYMLSDNPNFKSNSEITIITSNDLKNPKTNISIGCILFRKCLERMNFHVGAAICCYNQGPGNMTKIFRETYAYTGLEKEDILEDQTNFAFYDYTYASRQGDPYYVTNVLRYMENSDVIIKMLNDDRSVENLTINFIPTNTRY